MWIQWTKPCHFVSNCFWVASKRKQKRNKKKLFEWNKWKQERQENRSDNGKIKCVPAYSRSQCCRLSSCGSLALCAVSSPIQYRCTRKGYNNTKAPHRAGWMGKTEIVIIRLSSGLAWNGRREMVWWRPPCKRMSCEYVMRWMEKSAAEWLMKTHGNMIHHWSEQKRTPLHNSISLTHSVQMARIPFNSN